MKEICKLLLLTLLYLPFSLFAQKPANYSFRHLNIANGFPAESVYAMEFDSTGQLWALTEKGLMCYNGHSGKHYGVKSDSSGLMKGRAYDLYMDNQGKLWITYFEAYLSVFDPSTEVFTHFIHDENDPQSFPDAMAGPFLEDQRGNFWIGTWGGGLLNMNREMGTFSALLPDETNELSLGSVNVSSLTELDNGDIIVGTWDEVIDRNFLSVLDPEKEEFERFPFDEYGLESEVERAKILQAFKIVHFVTVDENDNWWVGTYTGLFYVNHEAKTIERITGLDKDLLNTAGQITFDNVLFSLAESENLIWFPTEVGGILLYDKQRDEVRYIKKDIDNSSSLSGNIIRDAVTDRYGNIWVATNSGGLDVYCPNEQQVKIVSNEFLEAAKMNNAQGMFAINHMAVSNVSPNIILAHGNGVSVYNTETRDVYRIEIREEFNRALKSNPSLQKFNNNNPNFVGVVHELNGTYIFGTYCGEVRYTVATGKIDFSRMEYSVGFYPSEYAGEETILMIAGERTASENTAEQIIPYVAKLNTKTLQEEKVFVLPWDLHTGEVPEYRSFERIDSIRYYVHASKNTFLIFNSQINDYKMYSTLAPHSNLPDSNYRLLHIDNFGIIWFETENCLFGFDHSSGQLVDILPELQMGPKDDIKCLTRDAQGILWIALSNDLIRYNHNTKESFRFTNEHGFDAGGFSERFIRRHNRPEVIIPANYGLLVFDPTRIVYHTIPPKMFLSEIVIGKDTLSTEREREFTQKTIELEYNENFITIEFATDLLYATGGKTYHYRLIGLDSTWVSTNTSNKVSYTNLQPGEYRFEVNVTDGYGNMSNTLATSFIIDKPFWLKWWFITAEIFLGLLLIWIYITYRERKLKHSKMVLERAVEVRTHEVQEKANEIEKQKGIIEVKNKEMTDSINYAKGIQDSLLAHRDLLEENLPAHAIFFKPKDIVSGDFYWATKGEDAFYLAVCDSTGHGVPGAFMSLLNIRYLNEAVVEKGITSPNIVFDYVRRKLIENLAVDGTKDGMDGTLIKWDEKNNQLIYSSAQNHPVLIRDQKPEYLPADKMPIGGGFLNEPFQPHTINLQKGDVVYFFTDGYPDQFGGPKGGKLKHANLIKFLLTIHHLPVDEQVERMEEHLMNWKGDLEQLDDILLVALKFEN